MKTKRMVVPAALIVLILIALSLISPVAVGHAEPMADPTDTQAAIATTEKPPDPTPGPGVTETLEPTKTPPAIETTNPTDPTPEPGVTETLQPTKTDEPAITETASPAPSATNTESVQSSETPTQVASGTTQPTDTATPTSSPIATLTPSPTHTSQSRTTPTLMATPVGTSPTPTASSTSTATASHTPEATVSATFEPTGTPIGTATESATPGATSKPVDTPAATEVSNPAGGPVSTTVRVVAEGDARDVAAYIVGRIRFTGLLKRTVYIGTGWVWGDGTFRHALKVAGRISENDYGIHQKFMPELTHTKRGDIVWIDDSKYEVRYVVKVAGKNQAVMERLLANWTTITTCTADWKDNLVVLLAQVPERWK